MSRKSCFVVWILVWLRNEQKKLLCNMDTSAVRLRKEQNKLLCSMGI